MPAPVLPLVDIAPLLPARGALIGLDLGSKTIGVATSDPDRRLATAVETVARKTFSADAARLLGLAGERKAAGFVLGLPLNMDGSEGPRAQSTRAFARNFSRLTELADRALGRAPLHRRRRARADRRRRHAGAARQGHRPARRGLHPAGRARPPAPATGDRRQLVGWVEPFGETQHLRAASYVLGLVKNSTQPTVWH